MYTTIASWREDMRLMLSISWWTRTIFFVGRRLTCVWRSISFWAVVLLLLAHHAWQCSDCTATDSESAPSLTTCLIAYMLLEQILLLLYVLVVFLLVRVSIFPQRCIFFLLFFKNRGFLGSALLFVPLVFLSVGFIFFPLWVWCCLWFLIAADAGNFTGKALLFQASRYAARLLWHHILVWLLLLLVVAGVSFLVRGLLIVQLVVILPTVAAVSSVLYTMWQDEVRV